MRCLGATSGFMHSEIPAKEEKSERAGGDFVRFRIAQKFPSFFPTTPISDGWTDRPPALFPTVRPSEVTWNTSFPFWYERSLWRNLK